MDTTQGVLNLYKKRGETPLERLNRYKDNHPEFKNVKMTYAGRLDPLAEGVLIVLFGEKIKNKEKYIALDKKYEFRAILGVETDTYDVLGKVKSVKSKVESVKKENIEKEIENFIGKRTQEYPTFSSRTVKGKALFDWAKEGRLSEIKIPKREIEIYKLQLINEKTITKRNLEKLVFSSITKVKGDFRQKEIKRGWEKFFEKSATNKFQTIRCTISCSSGTYIRAITYILGRNLIIGATAISIIRTAVGSYSIHDSLR